MFFTNQVTLMLISKYSSQNAILEFRLELAAAVGLQVEHVLIVTTIYRPELFFACCVGNFPNMKMRIGEAM